MAAGAWKIYDSLKEKMSDGTLDLDGDTFKCALFTSSHTPTQADNLYSALSGEVASGSGYTTGGVTLTSVTWTESSGTVTFDAGDPSWTASGGSIVARYAVIYESSTSQLVAQCVLDDTPADVTCTDGSPMTIILSSSGIFTISGGWS